MLIYIHGFNSSSNSGKARELRDWMDSRGLGEALACPDLPHRPAEAIRLLEGLIARAQGRAKLIGSSLGGFYALSLAERHGLKAVHINPCVACHEKLAGEVGKEQSNWHSGDTYYFTASHLAELQALNPPGRIDPGRHLLLLETGDDVLDYREAAAYFQGARQIVLEGGNHGFSRFAEYIPAIVEF
jgi:hypothetical protein